jgi:FKBP-type peptidyl-prolyl cis-trans isomerase
MKTKLILMAGMVLFAASFCRAQNTFPALITSNDSVAYVIGLNIGSSLKKNIENDSLSLSYDLLIKGFIDACHGLDSSVLNRNIKEQVMMNFQRSMQESQAKKMEATAAPNKAAGAKFLAENKNKEGIIETSSGLQYKIIKVGHGKMPTATDKVTVQYEGKLIDGTIFDSSYGNDPVSFPLSGVIKGWTEGLQLMKEGSSFELYIPSDLAYGDQGVPSIPEGSTLIFKVDFIKIEPQNTEVEKQGKKKRKAKDE